MGFPINNSEIEKTEKELNIIFPESYKIKMNDNNGGSFETDEYEWELIPIKDTTNMKRLSRTCNDIFYELKETQKWDNFPANCYPIAQNGFGDYLVFIKIESNNLLDDKVLFWGHENSEFCIEFQSFSEIVFD